mmetsp:Transcript_25911/g.58109  ORF Transcript_25911/g.58109 Transcript_25911/m.58109 type:complete len:327 (+) Transcript_25911:52-1032(+)
MLRRSASFRRDVVEFRHGRQPIPEHVRHLVAQGAVLVGPPVAFEPRVRPRPDQEGPDPAELPVDAGVEVPREVLPGAQQPHPPHVVLEAAGRDVVPEHLQLEGVPVAGAVQQPVGRDAVVVDGGQPRRRTVPEEEQVVGPVPVEPVGVPREVVEDVGGDHLSHHAGVRARPELVSRGRVGADSARRAPDPPGLVAEGLGGVPPRVLPRGEARVVPAVPHQAPGRAVSVPLDPPGPALVQVQGRVDEVRDRGYLRLGEAPSRPAVVYDPQRREDVSVVRHQASQAERYELRGVPELGGPQVHAHAPPRHRRVLLLPRTARTPRPPPR